MKEREWERKKECERMRGLLCIYIYTHTPHTHRYTYLHVSHTAGKWKEKERSIVNKRDDCRILRFASKEKIKPMKRKTENSSRWDKQIIVYILAVLIIKRIERRDVYFLFVFSLFPFNKGSFDEHEFVRFEIKFYRKVRIFHVEKNEIFKYKKLR